VGMVSTYSYIEGLHIHVIITGPWSSRYKIGHPMGIYKLTLCTNATTWTCCARPHLNSACGILHGTFVLRYIQQ
jgi:hypothetical protein